MYQIVCDQLEDLASDLLSVSAAAAVIRVSGKLEAALHPMANTTAKSRHAARQLQMHASSASQPIVTQRRSTDDVGNAPRVLCIGVGGGSLPNFLSHHFPGMHVDAVELDPLVVRAASDYMGFPQHRRALLTSFAYSCYVKVSSPARLQLECCHPADFLLPWDVCKSGVSKAFTGLCCTCFLQSHQDMCRSKDCHILCLAVRLTCSPAQAKHATASG